MSNILPMSRRNFAVVNQALLPLWLGIAVPAFAAQSTSLMLKAAPNQTTTFPSSTFMQSPAAQVPGTNSAAGLGLNSPYSSMNGTVTICDQNISYTPAFGFTGNDTFNVTVTNSAGSVSSAIGNIVVQYVPTVAIQSDRTANLQLLGAAGTNYNVQASTDLKTWTNIGSVTAGTNGVVQFTDTNAASFPSRFYRVAP